MKIYYNTVYDDKAIEPMMLSSERLIFACSTQLAGNAGVVYSAFSPASSRSCSHRMKVIVVWGPTLVNNANALVQITNSNWSKI